MSTLVEGAGIARAGALQFAPQRVLVIKLSSLGDVVHALPVASALRRRYPSLRITWAVDDANAALVDGHPAIDRVIVFPSPKRFGTAPGAWLTRYRAALCALRAEPYDVAVDLQGLLRSALLALLSRAPRRIGPILQREGAWMISRPVRPPAGRTHVVDEYLACAEHLGASWRPVEFALPVQSGARAAVDRLLAAEGVDRAAPLIVLNPSSARPRKAWPAARWSELAGALRGTGSVVLVGGREQVTRHAAIAHASGGPVHDLTGRTSLAELIALLDRCALHVAPDTGSLHVAAALGRPVLGVYGPTSAARLGPFGQLASVVQHADACGATCPTLCLSRRACLRAIPTDAVVTQARQLLGL